MARYAVNFLRQSDQYARFFMYPDIFLDWIFKKAGVDWSPKEYLLKALEGEVRRPASTFVRFRPKEQLVRKPNRNDFSVNALAKKLEKEGVVFLKPTGMGAAEGWGITRIQKNEKGLIITTGEGDTFRKLIEHLPTGYFKRVSERKLVIPLGRNKPLRNALGEIVWANYYPRHVAESEIRMPLYEGKKWEIRAIVQSPDRKPVVIGHVAKLGAPSSIVSNIAQGGRGEESSKVVSGIYRSIYPHRTNAEIGALTTEFFHRANTEAEKSVGAINAHLKRMVTKYLSGFPLEEVYAREAAVDITAELNPRTGKLDPIIGEVQYPDFGGIHEFKTLDPLGFARYKKNQVTMAEKGKKALMRHFAWVK